VEVDGHGDLEGTTGGRIPGVEVRVWLVVVHRVSLG
jgi:hypothetical protein